MNDEIKLPSSDEADRQGNDTMLAHEWIRPALNLPDDAPYRFDYYAQKIEELMAMCRARMPSDKIRGMADTAYSQYIQQMRAPECLGWEQKVKTGKFGEAELKAHTRAGEFLGRHRAFHECVEMLSSYGGSQPSLEHAAREVLETELADLACTGSDAPAEHALGLLKDALAGQPAASTEPPVEVPSDSDAAIRFTSWWAQQDSDSIPEIFKTRCLDFMFHLWNECMRPQQPAASAEPTRCEDCPPVGYPTDKTRCAPCDRRVHSVAASAEPVEWEEAQRIADLPEIDELLLGFAEDPTGDNGTMIVRAVLAKLKEQA